MKVLHQLIKHFWQRGVLTKEQADYLVEHGFIWARDLDFYEPLAAPPDGDEASFADRPFPIIDETPDVLEEKQKTLSAPPPAKRKGRSGTPRISAYSLKQLGDDLRTILRRREAWLPALVKLAGLQSAGTSNEQAAAVVRQLSQESFRLRVVQELRAAPGLLAKWWEYLDPEPFHSLLAQPEARGPVVRAFEAILTAASAGAWGQAGWLLKVPEVQTVANLMTARRQLLPTIRWLYEKHRSTLGRCVRRPARPPRSWQALGYGIVLVYNAKAWRAKRKPAGYVLTHQPRAGGWREAWTVALSIDAEPVIPYCVHIFGSLPAPSVAAAEDFAPRSHELICPSEWKI